MGMSEQSFLYLYRRFLFCVRIFSDEYCKSKIILLVKREMVWTSETGLEIIGQKKNKFDT